MFVPLKKVVQIQKVVHDMNRLDGLLEKWYSLMPLSADDERRLERKFMLEFNYNSNHIEGNTLTYGQTELLLLFGKVVNEANMKDLEEMKAHNVCLQMMLTQAHDKESVLSETFIRQLHKVMLREDYTVHRQLPGGKMTSYVVHAGCYKTRPNSVITPTGERFDYASPEETPALMYDLVKWYNDEEEAGVLTPIELAALFHYRYIRIHPFEDGNGRIARLLVNYILLRNDYPMVVVRSKLKKDYLAALNQTDVNVGILPSDGAHAGLEAARPFVDYFTALLCREIKDNMSFISEKDENVWWFNGEFVKFRSENTVRILNVLTENPSVTVRALVEIVGINKSAIQKQLKSLQDKEYIVRTNGNKGVWHVAIVCTTAKGGTKQKGGTVKLEI